ncbi:histidine phosphatase family protein [Sulfobacillus thermosulfidooxidans]|uniref:histidine phosphatase family protein n=1 Tax=Sulfobacillus thermosulfidooxidans TaxID=28034 RepID=UPI000368E2B5|nr:histidine phosphatase family protein [Sulfobacillus thermosulfidooxidans]
MDTFASRTFWVMRHGRPDLPRNPFFMDHDQFNRYLEAYDRAALSDVETQRLTALFQQYPVPDLVICSDLPRAQATAELFARSSPIIVDPTFREIPVWLPDASTKFLKSRWPEEFWWSYLRLNWFRDQGPEGKTRSRQRAQEAITRLLAYQEGHQRIALVSHAGFLSLLITMLHQQHRIKGPLLPSIRFGRPTNYTWVKS